MPGATEIKWHFAAEIVSAVRLRAVPLFRRKRKQPSGDQSVILHIPLSDAEFGEPDEREDMYRLEDVLEEAVVAVGGEVDGHEFGGGETLIFIYGPDADNLLEVVQQNLGDFDIPEGTFALKRYGGADNPDAREERVPLR
jgi:hypothetical protein